MGRRKQRRRGTVEKTHEKQCAEKNKTPPDLNSGRQLSLEVFEVKRRALTGIREGVAHRVNGFALSESLVIPIPFDVAIGEGEVGAAQMTPGSSLTSDAKRRQTGPVIELKAAPLAPSNSNTVRAGCSSSLSNAGTRPLPLKHSPELSKVPRPTDSA